MVAPEKTKLTPDQYTFSDFCDQINILPDDAFHLFFHSNSPIIYHNHRYSVYDMLNSSQQELLSDLYGSDSYIPNFLLMSMKRKYVKLPDDLRIIFKSRYYAEKEKQSIKEANRVKLYLEKYFLFKAHLQEINPTGKFGKNKFEINRLFLQDLKFYEEENTLLSSCVVYLPEDKIRHFDLHEDTDIKFMGVLSKSFYYDQNTGADQYKLNILYGKHEIVTL